MQLPHTASKQKEAGYDPSMLESRLSLFRDLLAPRFVKILLGLVGSLGTYDAASSQFDWPKLPKVWGMSGGLLPWWGWLLVLQAIFVYALFEYVRKLRKSPQTNVSNDDDLTTVTDNLLPKIDQVWEYSRAISDGVSRVEARTTAIEQKLYETVIDRIVPIENTLRPQGAGLLGTLLMAPEDSRFDQIIADIQSVRESINLLHISKAVKYKLILEVVTKLNQTIMELTPKLISASPSDYADDAAWRVEYDEWRYAVSQTDNLCDFWISDYRKYLEISQTDFENAAAMPPENGNLTVKENGTRYQTVKLVSERWAKQQAGVLSYLEGKAWTLPS